MSNLEVALGGAIWSVTILIAYLLGQAKGERDATLRYRRDLEDLESLLGEGGTD